MTTYQFGIEEELFLADANTRGTPKKVEEFHKAIRNELPEVERELLESQVEIMTQPSTDFGVAREALAKLRSSLSAMGREHGILVLAGGTHPTARWSQQSPSQKDRYTKLSQELQMLARRDVVCGMHVHVEVPDPDRRVDLMNRFLPYTPLLLGLSASSPFWQGQKTGLCAYRLSVWGEMPRTGLPEIFDGKAEYDRYVEAMVRSGTIADGSFLWWTIRPSIHFPTLELRVADSCTRLNDTIAIAALYRCLVRRLDRDPELNNGLTTVARAITSENMWRAQRDGVRARFIDEHGVVTPFAECLSSVLHDVKTDAEALGCWSEVQSTQNIVSGGTSADKQLAVFAGQQDAGKSHDEALTSIVDWMSATTVE